MMKIECTRMLLPVLLACAAPAVALGQTAYLEQSAVVGEGKTIFVSRLPVVAGNGKVTYWDGTINLAISGSGMPSLAASPPFVMSARLVTDHFKTGRYSVKYGTCTTQFANLESGVGSAGSTVWSLILETPASCGGAYPNQATWQTGAPAPDVAARLAAAKVPDNPNYSYGLTNVGGGSGVGNFNVSNGLLAADQISDRLELISYTDGYGHDQPGDQGSIIFVLCVDATCSKAPK